MQTSVNNFSRRLVIILLACGFAAILAASIAYRFANPDLTISRIAMDSGRDQPARTSMDSADMSAIGKLMQDVSKNPGDENSLLRLVESLMALGQWGSAENFAQKAMSLENSKDEHATAMYLLALIHHNKGENEQAADLLEKMLEKGENPSARYSLGILYLHFLNKPAEGIAQLRKGLADPGVTPALAKAMRDELEKIGNTQNGDNMPMPSDKPDAAASDALPQSVPGESIMGDRPVKMD